MKVNIGDEYPYVVVQFLQQPYADIDDYICVPHSWIRIRRATDRKCVVAYPCEPPLLTKMRIMNGDKPSEKWQLYMAIIKFETYLYENANKFIKEKNQNASKIRYSGVVSPDYNLAPAAATEGRSSLLKRTILPDPQLEKNIKKGKVINKARLSDTISNSSKSLEHPNVELIKATSSKLPSYVSPKNIMIKKTDGRENREQIFDDVRPRDDDLGSQLTSSEAGFPSTMGKTLYASQNPLIFVNQICDGSQQTQGNQQLSIYRDHLHHIALTKGRQYKGFPNLRIFDLDVPKPLTLDVDMGSDISLIIQNSVSKTNQSSQEEVPQSPPVYQDHQQVSSTEKIPEKSSEGKRVFYLPNTDNKIMNASYASVGCSNSVEHQNSTIEEMVVDKSSKVRYNEQNVLSQRSAESESSAAPSSLDNATHSDHSVESYMQEGPSVVHVVTSSDVSSNRNFDSDKQNTYLEISSEEILTASTHSNKQANRSVDYVLNKADVWADQLFDLFQKMKVDVSETCQFAHDTHKSLVQSQEVIECIANASKNLRELKKGKANVVTSKRVTVDVQQKAEENQVEGEEKGNPDIKIRKYKKGDDDVDSKKSQNNDDDVDNDEYLKVVEDKDRDNEAPKTTRGHIRTFVLPPEYDPDDTRWTLKYRENDPKHNLVELVPQSNVFINSIKLAHCKRTAKDSKALARMLLVEIFSQSALSVCSLTGVRANAFDISGTHVRPGLDERARMAIMSFVEEHASKMKWGVFDSQSIINSIRSKIQEIRAKHGKTA